MNFDDYWSIKSSEELDCSICVEPLKGELWICGNGHSNVCEKCRLMLNNTCPFCKSDFLFRNRSLENLLKVIYVSCTYFNRGCCCFVKYNRRPDHEAVCKYKNTKCPFKDCPFSDYESLSLHLKQQHSFIEVISGELYTISLHNHPVVLAEKDTGTVFILETESNDEDSNLMKIWISTPSVASTTCRYDLHHGNATIFHGTVTLYIPASLPNHKADSDWRLQDGSYCVVDSSCKELQVQLFNV